MAKQQSQKVVGFPQNAQGQVQPLNAAMSGIIQHLANQMPQASFALTGFHHVVLQLLVTYGVENAMPPIAEKGESIQ